MICATDYHCALAHLWALIGSYPAHRLLRVDPVTLLRHAVIMRPWAWNAAQGRPHMIWCEYRGHSARIRGMNGAGTSHFTTFPSSEPCLVYSPCYCKRSYQTQIHGGYRRGLIITQSCSLDIHGLESTACVGNPCCVSWRLCKCVDVHVQNLLST